VLNEYKLIITRETPTSIYFNFFTNNELINKNDSLCLKREEFDQFFKDLFKGSRGNCIRATCRYFTSNK